MNLQKLFNKVIRYFYSSYQPTSKYIGEISKLYKINNTLHKQLVTYQNINNKRFMQAKEDALFKRMVKERNLDLYNEIVDILTKEMLIKDKEKIKELEKIIDKNSVKSPTKIHLTKLAIRDLKHIKERDNRAEQRLKSRNPK